MLFKQEVKKRKRGGEREGQSGVMVWKWRVEGDNRVPELG